MREFWTVDQIRTFMDPKMDRRTVLKAMAGVAGGAVLGPYFQSSAQAAIGGTINVLAWEGFTLEPELKAWREKNGITQNTSIISLQDDVQNKLIGSNPLPIDVSEYNNAYSRFYGDELKIIHPVDLAMIPNFNKDSIFPFFFNGERWNWDGKQFGIPWIWGLVAPLYNPKVLPKFTQMEDFLKPEFKGKLTFVDDVTGTWPTIARVGGMIDKFPHLTVDEMNACFEAAKPYRDQCKVFAASNGDVISLFASGEIDGCFNAWTGITAEVAKQNIEIDYALEGAVMWCDAWFIPTSATNIETAHAFINESLTPKVQASAAKTTVSGAVVKAAVAEMDDATRALFDYNNLEEVFKKAPLPDIPPRESDKYAIYDQWVEAWTAFKGGF